MEEGLLYSVWLPVLGFECTELNLKSRYERHFSLAVLKSIFALNKIMSIMKVFIMTLNK